MGCKFNKDYGSRKQIKNINAEIRKEGGTRIAVYIIFF